MKPRLHGSLCLGTSSSAHGEVGPFFHLCQAKVWTPTVPHGKGGGSFTRPTCPGGGLQARPHPHPRPCTCAIHRGVAGLCRPPALPFCLLHLRHIEVSLPCQGAHEIDLVLLVDLQPWVGTQLPLLVGEHERQNEPSRASDPCAPKWPQKLFTVYSLPGGWLLPPQSPPSSKSLLREAPTQHPVDRGPHPRGQCSNDLGVLDRC